MANVGSFFETSVVSSLDDFPSPWMDRASADMPVQLINLLNWCQYIYEREGTYRMAMERVIAYFLTDVEISSPDPDNAVGDDEKKHYENFFRDTLDITGTLQVVNRDKMAYGNGFCLFHVPFRRFLTCPKCFLSVPLHEVAEHSTFRFEFQNFKFIATCPHCKTLRAGGYRGEWIINDEPGELESELRVKRLPPQEMEIEHDIWSGENSYLWKIPEDYRRELRAGKIFVLERAPLPLIQAVKNNQLFRFNKDVIFHSMEPTLSGIRCRGWGLPRLLTVFRDLWYVQVLRRYNEAIALDYVIPFRVITPEARTGSGTQQGMIIDPMLSNNMGDFAGAVRAMLRRRRRDPAGWHTLPFPIRYQALGGDARMLAPKELLDQAVDTALNAAGSPVDFYRSTLTMQTAVVSLRLFQATWQHLVNDNNRFLRWVILQVSRLLGWERVDARMRPVTLADDFNRQMMIAQLMMGQAISQTTGLKALGIEFKDEQRQLAEEARFQQAVRAEVQKEMEQSSYGEQIAQGQLGAPGAPGAAPAQPGAAGPAQSGVAGTATGLTESPDTPMTPEDVMAEAGSLASQLLTMPESQKDSELRALKARNPILHSVVRAELDRMRRETRMQGGAMLMGK